uniref:Uncharacterized protein n=1 Tax=Marseillevirus LCMAC201 TaxID=2506605 RepID=A0A481YWZ0_9VIRU|nr:MAG: hypothetical protein LCMAC201_02150 [Marseillevirus LCMAC201]
MNNQTVLLLIAVGVLIAVLFVIPSSENFKSVDYSPHPDDLAVPYTAARGRQGRRHWRRPTAQDCLKNPADCINPNPDVQPKSSVDCSKFPDDPVCTAPPASPVDTSLSTCVPPDGQWSIPDADKFGRSKLKTPCCQPPDYKVASNYKTCDDTLNRNNPIEKCIATCCSNAASEAANYDTSWYPMARCACSLWCYNQNIPHFRKYGTAVHYITGDIAEAQTDDDPGFIGSGGGGFEG